MERFFNNRICAPKAPQCSFYLCFRPALCYSDERSVSAEQVRGLRKLIQQSIDWDPARYFALVCKLRRPRRHGEA